jgi:hypothetical protein
VLDGAIGQNLLRGLSTNPATKNIKGLAMQMHVGGQGAVHVKDNGVEIVETWHVSSFVI